MKAKRPVDAEELLVGPEVEERHAPRLKRMQEARGRHAGIVQPAVGRRTQITAADSVDQDANLHAALLGADQRVDEGAAGRVGAEDVARQAHAHTRGVDGGDHLRIGVVAILDQVDGIAVLGQALGELPSGLFERSQRDRRADRTDAAAGASCWDVAAVDCCRARRFTRLMPMMK